MPISPASATPRHPTETVKSPDAKAPGARPPDADEAAAERKVSAEESVRRQTNTLILKASLEVSLKAGDQSMSLLFRSAIDRINEILGPELGPDAIQAAAAQDNSPEATAERILSLSTGFFDAYAAQHPGKDSAALAQDFVDLIRGGFERGFNDAKDILQGLGVLDGDIKAGIMQTYDYVHKGLDDFLAARLTPGSGLAT